MKYLEAIELKSMLDTDAGLVILDVREPYEVEICSIGGLSIPMGDVCDRVEELKDYERIVVMCRTGKRAEAVANLLIQDFGLTNVVVLKGGLQSWIDEVDSSIEGN